jgi:hypothetical protein
MPSFVFKGQWRFPVKIPSLASLRSDRFFKGLNRPKELALFEAGEVMVSFADNTSPDPDPLPEQLAAFDALLNEQDALLQGLLVAVRDEIFPVYLAGMDDEPECFPNLSSVADLDQALGIQEIRILRLHKEGIAYVELSFEFSADEEHGLSLIMHRDRLVDFGGHGDLDQLKTRADSGEEIKSYNEFVEEQHALLQASDRGPFMPHPKYGVLKPSQAEANLGWLQSAIRDDDITELSRIVDEYTIDLNYRYHAWEETLLKFAVQQRNPSVIGWLLEAGTKPHGEISVFNHSEFDLEIAKLLVGHGENLNLRDYWQKTPIVYRLRTMTGAAKKLYFDLESDAEKRKELQLQIKTAKQHLEWLLANGADPTACDAEGHDLLHLYDHHMWAEHVMAKIPLRNWLVEVLAKYGDGGKEPNKPWWKRWWEGATQLRHTP